MHCRPFSTSLDVSVSYLRKPESRVEDQDRPFVIQKSALEDDCGEPEDIEPNVKLCELAAHRLIIKHDSLVLLSSPNQHE